MAQTQASSRFIFFPVSVLTFESRLKSFGLAQRISGRRMCRGKLFFRNQGNLQRWHIGKFMIEREDEKNHELTEPFSSCRRVVFQRRLQLGQKSPIEPPLGLAGHVRCTGGVQKRLINSHQVKCSTSIAVSGSRNEGAKVQVGATGTTRRLGPT